MTDRAVFEFPGPPPVEQEKEWSVRPDFFTKERVLAWHVATYSDPKTLVVHVFESLTPESARRLAAALVRTADLLSPQTST